MRKMQGIPVAALVALLLGGRATWLAAGEQGAAPAPDIPNWKELNGTKIRSVLAPAPAGVPPDSWWNPKYIMDYCGAAFDTKRNRLIVWGGGHSDYPGNELYAIELTPAPRAVRLTDPSPYTTDIKNTVEVLADGHPDARHTYDGLVYLPEQDALWSHGGSLWRSGTGSWGTWMFHFATGTWERKLDGLKKGGTSISGYDPVTKQVVLWSVGFLATYDPATDKWVRRGAGTGTNSERTGVIDSARRKMYVFGFTRDKSVKESFRSVDLNTWSQTVVKATGETAILDKVAPGAELDPETGEIVLWAGGAEIFRLNLDTRACRKETPGGAVPGPAPWSGTYGRFAYVPALKKFVGVSAIDQNAFLYTPGAPAAESAPVPAPHKNAPPGTGK